jgi:isoquinoline 1-oxidoreductase alpha subunit
MAALMINGQTLNADVDPDTPLLWALREQIGLTGTKYGCGIAQCGACTVHVDGVATRSCSVPVSAVMGKQITTIEGLAQNGVLHKVQKAWIDHDVPQCGYCQSGMMIAAVELLAKNPNPTVTQIKDAFTNKPPSPHLCRCGTYAAIIDAVQRAAKAMKP